MSSPIGYMDDAQTLDGYGTALDMLLEQVPELLHPYSVRTYAKMRHDPQVKAVLKAYMLAIRRGNWVVNGDGCRDEVTQRISDDIGLPIKGTDPDPTGARRRKFTWAKHLRLASSLALTFGHAPFAQQWDEISGQWRLGMVQERMPQTIEALHLNPDGTLRAAEQAGMSGQRAPMITTADHQLVWYAHEREGSNYYGQSLIREAYGPWLVKDQMIRTHATSIKRFGMGIPTAQALPGTSPQPNEMEAALRAVSHARGSAHGGVAMPPGFRYALEGMTGTVPDALAFINYLDRQMTRATLTSILDMATAEKGNRSLGETVMDLMVTAQQVEADALAEDATEQIVIPLIDANWGEDEPAPIIECSDVGADIELTAQDLNWLFEYGGLRPDTPARAWIRQRYKIPDEDPNYQPPTQPGAVLEPSTGGAA